MELSMALALSFAIIIIASATYHSYDSSSFFGKISEWVLNLISLPIVMVCAFFNTLANGTTTSTPAPLSNNTLAILAFLQEQGLNKKFTTHDVMTALNMQASITVGCLTSLVNKGFVKRTPVYEDGKEIKYLQITIEGFNYDIFKRE